MAVKDTRAAKRYALALFNNAVQAETLDAVEKDLATLLSLMQASAPLKAYWESPLVPSGKKRERVAELLGSELSGPTLAFLRLLADKRREDLLDAVIFEFRRQLDGSRKLARAEAVFAVQPTDAETAALVKSLEKRTGENVSLTVSVDPTILGGVVVRMRDHIIDGSVRGSLERVRERLLQEA